MELTRIKKEKQGKKKKNRKKKKDIFWRMRNKNKGEKKI